MTVGVGVADDEPHALNMTPIPNARNIRLATHNARLI
jgi:hypothetical protein